MSIFARSNSGGEIPTYSQTTQPTLAEGETAVWINTSISKMFLLTKVNGITFTVGTSEVENAITDGVTDKAPSEDAVYDALASKSDNSHGHTTLGVLSLTDWLKLKNTYGIKWRNYADTADLIGIKIGVGNDLILGEENTYISSVKQHYFWSDIALTDYTKGFYIRNSLGSDLKSIYLDSSDYLHIAAPNGSIVLNAKAGYGVDIYGDLVNHGHQLFENNKIMYWRNAANDAWLEALSVDSNNFLQIGKDVSLVHLYNKDLHFWNAKSIKFRNAADSAWFDTFRLDASNILQIGVDVASIKLNKPTSITSNLEINTPSAIDPDGTSAKNVLGSIADGSGWAVTGFGGNGGGTGKTWALGHNGSQIYFGIGNGVTDGSLSTAFTISAARIMTFFEMPVTPSAAPTTNYQVANKKYVDDSLANKMSLNAGNEISALTEKTSIANDDLFIIEDSAASYVKKKLKRSTIGTVSVNDINMARPTSNGYKGIWDTFTASEALSFGDICYLYSDSGTAKMKKAKANALTTLMAVAICIETSGIASGSSGKFLFYGFIYNSSWAWTVKDVLFVSAATAGAMTATAPSTTGQYVQSVGTAIDADTVYFNPNLMYWEVVA